MNITISGNQDGILKEVHIPLKPEMTVRLLCKGISREIGVDECQLQIKQNHFYFHDEEIISDVMKLDSSPFSFVIVYGSKHISILVDGCCQISMLKKRFSQIVPSVVSSLKIDYAIYNDQICKDSCSIDELGIFPYSSIYLCSEIYTFNINFPDHTTLTLYKHYNIPFNSILQEIAKHCSVDLLMISVYWIDSSKHILISSTTESLYQLFSQSTITLQVVLTSLQEMCYLIQEIEKKSIQNQDIHMIDELSVSQEASQLEKTLQGLQCQIEEQRHTYGKRVEEVLREIQRVSIQIDEMLKKLEEIEEIRKEQEELMYYCEIMEEYGVIEPEILAMMKSLNNLEATVRTVGGKRVVDSSKMDGRLKDSAISNSSQLVKSSQSSVSSTKSPQPSVSIKSLQPSTSSTKSPQPSNSIKSPQPSTSSSKSLQPSTSSSKSPQPSTSSTKSLQPSTSSTKSPQPSTSSSKSPQPSVSIKSPQPSTSSFKSPQLSTSSSKSLQPSTSSTKSPQPPLSLPPIHSTSPPPFLSKPKTIHGSLHEPLSPSKSSSLQSPPPPPSIRHSSLSPPPPPPPSSPLPPPPPPSSSPSELFSTYPPSPQKTSTPPPLPPKSLPPPPPSRRTLSPVPPRNTPSLSNSISKSPPPLPPSISSSDDSGVTLLKPSQMKGKMKLLEEMNSRLGNPSKVNVKPKQVDKSSYSDMPSLHASFAPPMRPKKHKI